MTKKNMFMVITIAVLFMGTMLTGFFVIWDKISSLELENKKEPPNNIAGLGSIYSLDTFIVNLADQNGKRYLRVTIDLELSSEALTEELNNRIPQITDSILTLLPTKKIEDICSVKGKIALRDEIMTKLNKFLTKGRITKIYFKEFVIQ